MSHTIKTAIAPVLPVLVLAVGCSAATVELRETTPVAVHARAPLPPAEPERVRVEGAQIRADERIFFETNSAVISPRSFQILDEIAQVIQDHPEIERIRVEGHTDHVGSAAYNRQLSEGRSEAVVEYLTGHGIEPDRLESRGYGFERPIASNEDEEGRSQNRRVEFRIIQPGESGPSASLE